jgi:hypothetical protein
MSRTISQRSVLSPPGHPSINEGRIRLQRCIRPKAQALRDAGTKSLNESIGVTEEFEY